MLEVRWKIGKKSRGRWRAPFQFTLEIKDTEVLNLRPRFIFQKEYELPTKIYAGTAALEDGCGTCKETKKINISINRYVEEPITLPVQMIFFECSRVCYDNCKVCLPWRPGKPDYSDFEQIFQQIASDLLEAWNKAVEEAASSEEYEGEEVIITSDLLIKRKEEEKLTEKPSRKIKIA